MDLEVNATKDPLTLGGKKVYSAYFEKTTAYPNSTCPSPPCEHPKEVGVGYRINNSTGVPKGDEPETLCKCYACCHCGVTDNVFP